MLKTITALAFLTSAGLMLPGCASVVGSKQQSILVSTKSGTGTPVEKAECTLTNPKGTWNVTTPSAVWVGRAGDDMSVDCKKPGEPEGFAQLISRANGGMFGNILIGGGIGALVDNNSGAGYDYPHEVVVVMGRTTVIDRRSELQAERSQQDKK
jgi:hypothetical protein